MARLAREGGFGRVEIIQTAGKPGVFATLDVGAPTVFNPHFGRTFSMPTRWVVVDRRRTELL